VYFKTAARCSAIANACVGHIERTDTDYYLSVLEKGGKRQRKALLEAAPAVLAYLDAGGIREDIDGPLFRPVAKDRQTLVRKRLDRSTILAIVKKYARQAGIDVERLGGRGIGVHSLRKSAITNALENGAPLLKVQQLAGHADVRTTQLYFRPSAKEGKLTAARRQAIDVLVEEHLQAHGNDPEKSLAATRATARFVSLASSPGLTGRHGWPAAVRRQSAAQRDRHCLGCGCAPACDAPGGHGFLSVLQRKRSSITLLRGGRRPRRLAANRG
jgi:hypothetical protein